MCDFFGWRRFRETDSRIPKFPQSFRFRSVSDLSRCEKEWNMETCGPQMIFYYRDKIGGKFRAISHLHLWNEKRSKAITRHGNPHRESCAMRRIYLAIGSVTGEDCPCSRVGNRTTFLYFKISNLFFLFQDLKFFYFFFFSHSPKGWTRRIMTQLIRGE